MTETLAEKTCTPCRGGVPPLKACRRANSSRQSLFFRLVHFTDVRCWHLADIPISR